MNHYCGLNVALWFICYSKTSNIYTTLFTKCCFVWHRMLLKCGSDVTIFVCWGGISLFISTKLKYISIDSLCTTSLNQFNMVTVKIIIPNSYPGYYNKWYI